jgi:hypothetical protein
MRSARARPGSLKARGRPLLSARGTACGAVLMPFIAVFGSHPVTSWQSKPTVLHTAPLCSLARRLRYAEPGDLLACVPYRSLIVVRGIGDLSAERKSERHVA